MQVDDFDSLASAWGRMWQEMTDAGQDDPIPQEAHDPMQRIFYLGAQSLLTCQRNATRRHLDDVTAAKRALYGLRDEIADFLIAADAIDEATFSTGDAPGAH